MMLFSILILSLVACGGADESSTSEGSSDSGSEEEKIVIRAANYKNEKEITSLALDKFAEEVERLSEGRVEIDPYHNAELGDEADSIERILAGSIEMGEVGSSGLSQFGMNATPINELPYLFDDFADFREILNNEEVRGLLSENLENNGMKLLAFRYHGASHIMSTSPLESIEDYKGRDFRAPEFDITIELLKSWGGSPNVIPYTEVYNALQTGVVEGYTATLTATLSERTYEVANNLNMTNHMYTPSYLVMNKDYFESFSSDVQEILLEAAKISEDYQIGLAEDQEEKDLQQLEAEGVNIVKYDDLTPFKEAIADKRQGLAEAMGPEAVELYETILKINE